MSRTLTKEEEQELLRQFEEMLKEDSDDELELTDFAYYNQVKYPDNEDLDYPEEKDEPPPLPKKVTCAHKKKKKVIISHNLKYWYCPDCKADLGDA